jgi:hypothetical protein
MAWIKVETVLPKHRKIGYLARRLNISKPTAIGHLICFWTSVIELAEDGNISKWNENDISEYAGWTGDPKAFYQALINEGDGWIDETKNGKFVHDWGVYAYNYLKLRYRTSNPNKLDSLKTVFSRSLVGLKTRPDKIREDNKKHCSLFDTLWQKYPEKIGRKGALRIFLNTIKTDEDFNLINKALDNYLNCDRVRKGYIQNATTWFNNWRDWIDYKQPEILGSGANARRL